MFSDITLHGVDQKRTRRVLSGFGVEEASPGQNENLLGPELWNFLARKALLRSQVHAYFVISRIPL
jgi:hypothetical protein